MLLLILVILIAIKVKPEVLISVEFAQTLIIYILSSQTSNQKLKTFINWLQLFKFDFEGSNLIKLSSIINWETTSESFEEIRFFWQWTLLNYSNIFIIITLIIIISMLRTLSCRSKRIFDKWTCKYNNSIHKFIIIMTYLVSPFLLINIISDVTNIQKYFLLIVWSFIAIIAVVTILLLKYPFLYKINLLSISSKNWRIIAYLLTAKIHIKLKMWHNFK